jgi:hypothetical protein
MNTLTLGVAKKSNAAPHKAGHTCDLKNKHLCFASWKIR